MADKWLSRLFGRAPAQPEPTTQKSESPPHVDQSPMSSMSSPSVPSAASDSRQLLKDIASINGSPVSSPPHITSFKSLDPSALNNGHSERQSLFVNTDTRKRQLTNSPDGLLASERVKRFRDQVAATRDEELDRFTPRFDASVMKPRMEQSFSGPYTQRNASMLDSPGGSSTISMFSRRSTAQSTHSNVSSKTRAILEQLERVATPQADSKRVSTFRPASTVPEVWNTSWHAGSITSNANALSINPPPLRRQPIQVPNRLHLLTSAMTAQYKKPYWRDIYRPKKPASNGNHTSSLQSPAIQRLQAATTVNVSPLFDLSDHPPPIAVNGKESASAATQPAKHSPTSKGIDAKKAPNTFNAGVILMEDSGDEQEKESEKNSPTACINNFNLPKSTAPPPKGFINDCLFEFKAPEQRGPQEPTTSEESSSGEDSSDTSDISETAPEAISQTKSTEKPTLFDGIVKNNLAVPAPTDSETSASAVATPSSSKNTSPESLNKTPVASTAQKWDCSTCLVSNEATVSKCVCCETSKPEKWDCSSCLVSNEASASKCVCCENPKTGGTEQPAAAPVFKPTTFVAPIPSGVSFGLKSKLVVSSQPSVNVGLQENKPVEPSPLAPVQPSINFGSQENKVSTLPTPSFNFGSASVTAPKTLQFGNSNPTAPSAAPPVLEAPSAQAPAAGSFTFASGSAPISSIPSFGGSAAPNNSKPVEPSPIVPVQPSINFGSQENKVPTLPTPSFNFGNASATAPKTLQFGASNPIAPPAAPFVFGAPSAQAPAAAFTFGSGPAPISSIPSFGGGASLSNSKPVEPSPLAPVQPSINFGSQENKVPTLPTPSFNFGNASVTAPKTFQFGASNPTAPSAAPFVFGAPSAQAPAAGSFTFASGPAPISSIPSFSSAPPNDSPFTFNSSNSLGPGGRKMANARRRLTRNNK